MWYNRTVMTVKNPLPEWLAAEWHPTKNGDLQSSQVTAGSSKKAWWVCPKGHTYDYIIKNRAKSGCPYCSGKRILAGYNDLASSNAVLFREWDFARNTLDPHLISPYSHQKVWWICAENHSWEAQVKSRNQGRKCPICARRKVATGINDLMTTHPVIAAEWHPTKNILQANQVLSGSKQKIWWQCSLNHEWESQILSRTSGHGCPVCVGKKVLEGFNDLATINSELVEQWHKSLNNILPGSITASSGKMVWWQCKQGHEWEASPQWRMNNGCPYCANVYIIKGHNDFGSNFTDLLKEWSDELNQKSPYSVSAGSGYKAWWECSRGHRWQTRVVDRVLRNYGCPQCAAHNYISQPEKELFAFLTSLGLHVEQSNRSVLRGIRSNEIDLYIPEKKFGVEFNGLYWHSEAQGKGKTYHEAKYKTAKEAGVQLVQVWEDDWRDRKDTVLRALAHKLGVTGKLNELYPELAVLTETVYARRTEVRLLSKDAAVAFLEANHIQGFANGSYYLGLVDGLGVLRAVLVLKKEAGTEGRTLNIIRYATYGSVVGGFTKLLKYAEKTYEPEDFITFADHCISDGGLYEGNGFVADKVLAPDYMYVVGGERKHKFGYRLKRFQNDPNLLWEAGLTERELAALNGLHRVWDAGKTRYRKTV